MSRDEEQQLPLWLPVISFHADHAVDIFGGMQDTVQRNKRLSRAADYLLHVSVSSVRAAGTPEATQFGGKVIGLIHFARSEPEGELHQWLAEWPWRFANPFPWKGAPGTFRVPLSALSEHLNTLEMAEPQRRLTTPRP